MKKHYSLLSTFTSNFVLLLFLLFTIFSTTSYSDSEGIKIQNTTSQETNANNKLIDEFLFINGKPIGFGDYTKLFKTSKYEHIFEGNKSTIVDRFANAGFEVYESTCKQSMKSPSCTSVYIAELKYYETLIGYHKLRIVLLFANENLMDFIVVNNYVGL